MAELARPGVRYAAFLSYSHKDAAAAGRLHRRLETYRLPQRLAGSEGARGTVPQRLWPIFRDRDELPAAADLSETVRDALARSGALIILCSPHAAASLWVAEEIKVFRELHPDRPVLAAILDGDPPDCFPGALRALGQDGTWHEPLATDLRRGRDGAHLGLLKLVAGITGVGLDALVQRDAARQIRRVTSVTAVTVIAMLIMTALAWIAVDARRDAENQRAEAEGQIEFMLTDLRELLKGVGRLDILTAVNQRALRYYGRHQDLQRLPADSLVRRARVLLAVGEDELNRRHYPAATAAFREAHRTTAEQLARAPRDAERIFAHSQSEYWVGYADYLRDDLVAARQSWQRYKELADRLLAINPAEPRWLRESGYAEGNLCTIAVRRPIDAALASRTCVTALRRVLRVRDLQGADRALDRDLANRHGWMVLAADANGRWDLAQRHQARHEALARSLIAADPSNVDYRDVWVRGQFGFGKLLAAHGRLQEARRRFAAAAAEVAKLRTRDPANASWRDLQEEIAEAMQGGA